MTDQLEIDHSGLQEVANAMRQDAGLGGAQKRKRESDSEDDLSHMNKRVSPNASSLEAGSQSDGNQHMGALQNYGTLHHNNRNGSAEHANNASDTATAALALYPGISIPQRTEDTFAAQGSDGDRNPESSFMGDSQQGNDSFMDTPTHTSARSVSKPAVGSDAWHQVRKDNHKEVERRRRETINEGINELAKIVPGCEKNKGSILQRAVLFINQLKDNETQNIEKWTLEKLLTEQAIAELSASNDKLKAENERAWREVETWKKTCQSAGVAPKKESGVDDH